MRQAGDILLHIRGVFMGLKSMNKNKFNVIFLRKQQQVFSLVFGGVVPSLKLRFVFLLIVGFAYFWTLAVVCGMQSQNLDDLVATLANKRDYLGRVENEADWQAVAQEREGAYHARNQFENLSVVETDLVNRVRWVSILRQSSPFPEDSEMSCRLLLREFGAVLKVRSDEILQSKNFDRITNSSGDYAGFKQIYQGGAGQNADSLYHAFALLVEIGSTCPGLRQDILVAVETMQDFQGLCDIDYSVLPRVDAQMSDRCVGIILREMRSGFIGRYIVSHGNDLWFTPEIWKSEYYLLDCMKRFSRIDPRVTKQMILSLDDLIHRAKDVQASYRLYLYLLAKALVSSDHVDGGELKVVLDHNFIDDSQLTPFFRSVLGLLRIHYQLEPDFQQRVRLFEDELQELSIAETCWLADLLAYANLLTPEILHSLDQRFNSFPQEMVSCSQVASKWRSYLKFWNAVAKDTIDLNNAELNIVLFSHPCPAITVRDSFSRQFERLPSSVKLKIASQLGRSYCDSQLEPSYVRSKLIDFWKKWWETDYPLELTRNGDYLCDVFDPWLSREWSREWNKAFEHVRELASHCLETCEDPKELSGVIYSFWIFSEEIQATEQLSVTVNNLLKSTDLELQISAIRLAMRFGLPIEDDIVLSLLYVDMKSNAEQILKVLAEGKCKGIDVELGSSLSSVLSRRAKNFWEIINRKRDEIDVYFPVIF